MTHGKLIACHECDLLQREVIVPEGGALRCRRCSAQLYRELPNSLDRALAFSLAAVVLFAVANLYSIVGLSVSGTVVETTLLGAVSELYLDGKWPIAGLVFLTTVLMPVLQTASMLWLLIPLKFNCVPWGGPAIFRLCRFCQPWGMTEVLILGLLVALVKLSAIASVVVGPALWSFAALMLVLAAAGSAFDTRHLWSRVAAVEHTVAEPDLDEASLQGSFTAAQCGLALCHDCGLLASLPADGHTFDCPRCGAAMHLRKPASLSRTWAFLVAAMVMYIPANMLPVMYTNSLFGAENDTILSGVVYLWTSESWPLALVVFVASIAVPMLKILALGYLTISTQVHSRWYPVERTRIYRMVEFVGRWSMLDIYVITMLVALVRFQTLATIQAGNAAIAFGAVVVLTMFAAMAFDPRLIWDEVERDHARIGEKA
ncbi:paraquat-inducible protein A [Cupriavidus metallidurans]|jgi:paraquat-inducible protein A|uniref:Paraquat-inducible protein A n=1 Tax=Cupriavidus metallidurans TaxID=119219 RepID=A0A482IWL7_9BURK|nr:paraquat-inducible protein A [Cupriavidus metallidurans]QBP13485.1 paraquat-inducible protein A [Cupriavidus metallidurans]